MLGRIGIAVVSVVASMGNAAPVDRELIDELCDMIRANYVFPDVANDVALHLESRADEGAYDDLDRMALSSLLTRDLQEFTKDRHFGVRPLPEGWEPPAEDPELEPAEEPVGIPWERSPFGVYNVDRLDGNIGYLDLREFGPVDVVRDSIMAAVQLLKGSSALVLDLRKNGGGDPATVQLLCSYLFDPSEPVHLNSLYFRPTDTTTEFWTNPERPELAMGDIPIYVLTSPYTFSGAEECAYNLQTRERATIVGETTGGGAHPVNGFPIARSVVAMIPVGRAINPVTKTNWEGVGVVPDVEVPSDEALDEARGMIFDELIANGDPRAIWGKYGMISADGGLEIDPETIREIVGSYTDREIRAVDGALEYRRKGAPDWRPLHRVDDDVYMIDGLSDFRLEVDRDGDGSIIGLRGLYRGNEDYSARE